MLFHLWHNICIQIFHVTFDMHDEFSRARACRVRLVHLGFFRILKCQLLSHPFSCPFFGTISLSLTGCDCLVEIIIGYNFKAGSGRRSCRLSKSSKMLRSPVKGLVKLNKPLAKSTFNKTTLPGS